MREVDRITIKARDDGRYDIQECHPEAVDSLNVAGQPFAFSSGTVEFGGDNTKYVQITPSRGGFQAVIWFDNMEPENVLGDELRS